MENPIISRIPCPSAYARRTPRPRARYLASALLAALAAAADCRASGTFDVSSPQIGRPSRGGTRPGRPAGAPIRRPQAQDASAVATSSGTLSYAGGSDGIGVMSGTPRVYLVVFGNQWGTPGTDARGNLTLSNDVEGQVPFLQLLFQGIGTGGERWSGILTQYCDGALVAPGATSCPAGAPRVGYPDGGAFAGIWYDDDVAAPAQATQEQLAAEAIDAAAHFGNTTAQSNRYAQYIVLSPSGTHPDGFNTPGTHFCAWHSNVSSAYGLVGYTNLPYVSDDDTDCLQSVSGSRWSPALDATAIAATHEYAETLTDFPAIYGWFNTTRGEIAEAADDCENGTPDALLVNTATGSFAMQLIWSNDTSACEILHPVIYPDTIFATALE